MEKERERGRERIQRVVQVLDMYSYLPVKFLFLGRIFFNLSWTKRRNGTSLRSHAMHNNVTRALTPVRLHRETIRAYPAI